MIKPTPVLRYQGIQACMNPPDQELNAGLWHLRKETSFDILFTLRKLFLQAETSSV